MLENKYGDFINRLLFNRFRETPVIEKAVDGVVV